MLIRGTERRPLWLELRVWGRSMSRVFRDRSWRTWAMLRILTFFPKVKESQLFHYFPHHSSITGFSWKVFGNREDTEATSWVSEWQNLSLSVVVLSHTACVPHLSSSHCFLELKGRPAWRKRGLGMNTRWREKGFSCSKCGPCLPFLLHGLVGRHVGFGITFLGLSSARQFHLISNFPVVISRNGYGLQPSEYLFSMLSMQIQL